MNISRALQSNNMPQNCGMKGMHENSSIKQQNISKLLPISENVKQQNMPKNCGMKGMHGNDAVKDDKQGTTGNIIDARA